MKVRNIGHTTNAYQMLWKMICIDNHIKSSKTRTNVEFFQSPSRSQEHQLPATQSDTDIVNILYEHHLNRTPHLDIVNVLYENHLNCTPQYRHSKCFIRKPLKLYTLMYKEEFSGEREKESRNCEKLCQPSVSRKLYPMIWCW